MASKALPANARSRTPRGQDRRRQILETATRLFSERGYVQTSLLDIAEQIGITGPAIYHYYDSKKDILLEIREAIIDDAIARVEQVLEASPEPRQAMETILRAHVETVLSNVEANIVFDRERGHLSDDVENTQRLKERQYERHVRRVFEEGVAQGSFIELDPTIAVATLLAGCNWTSRLGGNRSRRAVTDTVVDMLLRSITVEAR